MASVNLKIEKVTSSSNFAKFEIYPFERGYGNTFATPIRRVLLSSIKGTSLTSIKIKNVDHEFCSIKGIKEDVLHITINLQSVVFKMDSSDKEKVVLKVHGKKVITAGDLKVPGNVTIINPEVLIAELTDDEAQLEFEATLEAGFGFELAENEVRNAEVGLIPLNKSFSPVEKVNFNVESKRVGQRTDYETIVIEIDTNGAVSPEEALKQATLRFTEEVEKLNQLIQDFDESAVVDEEVSISE